MTKTIAILATMDTKGPECDYLRQEIERMGARALLIDFGVVGDPVISVDIPSTSIAERGGSDLNKLRQDPSRDAASPVMVAGSIAVLSDLISEGQVHAVVSLGGTQGTNNATQVMQTLPFGFPKLMLSTMASGDTAPYVGIRDITMMFSVSDILGLNPFFRGILTNAAGAAVGMANAEAKVAFKKGAAVVGMTNLGVLTQGTMRAIEQLNAAGYEVIVFHGVGHGGAAMEEMIREGVITAVFDYAAGDLADAMFGGIRACNDTRMTVAAELDVPQVVVPGGTDHLGIMVDPPNSIPDAFKGRPYAFHNPVIFVPRTTGDEGAKLIHEMARRIGSPSNTKVMLPLKGVSAYSIEGGPLRDVAADAALFDAARTAFAASIPVVEIDAEAESAEFIDAAVAALVALIQNQVTA